MPTNPYDAHRQWALRPPDERFLALKHSTALRKTGKGLLLKPRES